MTLRICHVDFIVLYQCKLLSLQHYILWVCILSMICISRTCFISCWDYIRITYIHEDDKGIRNFNHLSQKANLKHIILSKPLLSLFIFSLLYPCISLNFIYVFLSPGQGLVEHILVNLMELWLEIMWKERRSDAWWKDGQSCQRWKKKNKRIKNHVNKEKQIKK